MEVPSESEGSEGSERVRLASSVRRALVEAEAARMARQQAEDNDDVIWNTSLGSFGIGERELDLARVNDEDRGAHAGDRRVRFFPSPPRSASRGTSGAIADDEDEGRDCNWRPGGRGSVYNEDGALSTSSERHASNEVATLQADLYFTKYELTLAQEQVHEANQKLNNVIKEKNAAAGKYRNLSNELNASRIAADEQICDLTLNLQEKSMKLELCEKMQGMLDEVLVSDFPVSDRGNSSESAMVANYVDRRNCNATFKMEQSLELAKRLANERDHLEKCRKNAEDKHSDAEKKYRDLLLELNQLKLSDKMEVSELRSQLKVKMYEWDRLSVVYSSLIEEHKEMERQKEQLQEKMETMKEDFEADKTELLDKVLSLSLQLQEKTTQLESYENMENEMDKLVLDAAVLPDERDAEELFKLYGYGTSVPSNGKRRLEQSLKLARRVLELEKLVAEQKLELFSVRDGNTTLQEELDAAKGVFGLCDYSTTELLSVIQKRDIAIRQLKERVKQMDISKGDLKNTNLRLQEYADELNAKLSRTRMDNQGHGDASNLRRNSSYYCQNDFHERSRGCEAIRLTASENSIQSSSARSTMIDSFDSGSGYQVPSNYNPSSRTASHNSMNRTRSSATVSESAPSLPSRGGPGVIFTANQLVGIHSKVAARTQAKALSFSKLSED